MPLAERLSGWCTQAVKTLNLAERITHRRGLLRATCHSVFFSEIGVATQASIACDIIERSGRYPEHLSTPPPTQTGSYVGASTFSLYVLTL
jgi:hypothetical protein